MHSFILHAEQHESQISDTCMPLELPSQPPTAAPTNVPIPGKNSVPMTVPVPSPTVAPAVPRASLSPEPRRVIGFPQTLHAAVFGFLSFLDVE